MPGAAGLEGPPALRCSVAASGHSDVWGNPSGGQRLFRAGLTTTTAWQRVHTCHHAGFQAPAVTSLADEIGQLSQSSRNTHAIYTTLYVYTQVGNVPRICFNIVPVLTGKKSQTRTSSTQYTRAPRRAVGPMQIADVLLTIGDGFRHSNDCARPRVRKNFQIEPAHYTKNKWHSINRLCCRWTRDC